jgi:hypothetical protein
MFNSLATKHACCAYVIALGIVSFAWLGTFPGAAQSKKEKRVTSVRLGKGNEGSRVTVVSDSALTDYEAYRRGDRFYVKIPAGNFGNGVPSLRGEGFEDVQVQKAADGSVISFRLQPGTAARVDQRSNRLDVVFSSSGRTGTESAQTASVAEQSPAVAQNSPPTLPSSTSSRDHREPPASPNQIEQPTSLNTIVRENESAPQPTADENTSKPAPSETPNESSNSSLAQSAASPDSSIAITSQPQPSDTGGSQRLLVLGQAAQWFRGNWLVVLIALVPAALALLFLTYRRSKSEPIVPNEPEESDLSSSRTSNTEPVVLYPPTPDTTVGSPAAVAAAEPSDELSAEPVHSVTEPVHSIPVSPETTTHATGDTQPTESVLHASHTLIADQRLSDNVTENEQRERTEAEARLREEESRLAEEDAQVRAENEGRERVAAEARPWEEARRAEEEAQMKAEEEERRRAEAEARLREQAEARLPEEETRRAEEQARDSAEGEARLENGREILAGSEAETIQRAEEDARFRMEAETLRRAAEELARRRAQAKAARVAEEEARRRAEEENRQRLAEEARRHEEEEAQRLLKAEAQRRAEEQLAQSEVEARRRATEERLKLEQDALMQAAIELTRRRAEVEEARRRAERETRLLAQEQVRKEEQSRRLAEEERVKLEAETARRAQEEKSRFEESSHRVENDRRRVEELNLFKAEEREHRLTVLDAMKKQAEEQARQRAAHEQRIRAEIEVLRQAELEQDRRIEAETRRRADAEARLPDEPSRRQQEEAIRLGLEETSRQDATEAEMHAEGERELAQADKVFTNKDELSVPPVSGEEIPSSDNRRTQSEQESSMPPDLFRKLNSNESHERVVALAELAAIGGDDFFSFISRAFDDESEEVRNAAALALYNVQPDRAASFTRALREGSPERRQKIGAALATSGLASEAISNLTGDSREKTYDAFSLLFLMAKAGEVEPLMKAIDEHPSIEVRLAVVKLLALSGQAGILPEFRRLAVRGSLPSEVRAAVMDAIYQISSQAEESAHSAA